jgi:hypothetical protein
VLKVIVPKLPSRVALSTSTSPGEFMRDGTLPDGGSIESFGKTRYTSISTLWMLDSGVPSGINPVMVARLMLVVSVRIKSSAVSVSSFDALAGWESEPSRPSALPVLKVNESAQTGVISATATVSVAAMRCRWNVMAVLLDCMCAVSRGLLDRPLLRGK